MPSKRKLMDALRESNPDLASFIESYAYSESKDPEEVLIDIIQSWYRTRQVVLSNMSIDQLLAAFDFWNYVLEKAIRIAFTNIALWRAFSDVFTAFMQTYGTIYSGAQQAAQNEAFAKAIDKFFSLFERTMKQMQKLTSTPLTALLNPQPPSNTNVEVSE